MTRLRGGARQKGVPRRCRAGVVTLGVLLCSGCLRVPTNLAATTFPEVSGVWDYAVDEMRTGETRCTITGLSMTLAKIPGAGAFSGRAEGGRMTCTDDRGSLSVDLASYPVANGYTYDGLISFDLYNADWRHEGQVNAAGSSMSGSFVLRNGAVRYTGRFSAVKRRP